MNKFEKILDIIDHQEKYTDDEIREILRDEECRKLYQTMQEVDSVLLKQSLEGEDEKAWGSTDKKAWEGEDEKSSHGLNVDEAWAKFSEEHHVEENAEVIPMNSHADEHRPFSWRKIAASIVGFVLISGIAFAAIHTYISKSQEPMPIAKNAMVKDVVKGDTAKVASPSEEVKAEKPAIHKTFVNVTLDKMMTEIANYYDLQVKFESDGAKSLRLYYEWDSHTKIENIVKELNQFDNVNIVVQGKEIVVR